jgi:hypothetical protein
MADIFISYASKDRDHARKLATALEERGWSVWWDRKIYVGETFDLVIEHELDIARSVVVLWSTNSISSAWVRNEASSALKRCALAPALIDNVKQPLEFWHTQTANLVGWDGDASHEGFQKLCDAIAARDDIRGVVPHPPTRPRKLLVQWNRHWTLWVIMLVAAVLGFVAYFGLNKSGGDQKLHYSNTGDQKLHYSNTGDFCCDSEGNQRCRVITRFPLQIGTPCLCDGLGKGHVC